MKQTIWIIIAILVIWGAVSLGDKKEKNTEAIKVGAILPLSGVVSIWGETFQEGMEIAQKELQAEGVEIEVIYEDHRGLPTAGVSAYNKLVKTDNVDVVIPTFSRIAVPLIPLAANDNQPLIVSLVAASGVPAQNEFTYRLFHTAEQTGTVFLPIFEKEEYSDIAILYINDEFGKSVADFTAEAVEGIGITVTDIEPYLPDAVDFRTSLTKINANDPDALVFVGIPPASLANMIRQSQELGIEIPIFESAGILMGSAVRDDLGELAEGVYTIAYSSVLGFSGEEFISGFQETHDGEEPMWSVSLGYDSLYLIAEAMQQDGETLQEKLSNVNTFTGVNGTLEVNSDGEMNPTLYATRVVNGELEIVE